MNAPVSSLMQRQVWSIDRDSSGVELERLLVERHLTWAPVLESKRVMGVISAADLMQFKAQGRDPAGVRAWQLCTYKPITVSPDTPIRDVARLMVENQVHHVIVSDHSGIVGVVSSMDFVRTFAGE